MCDNLLLKFHILSADSRPRKYPCPKRRRRSSRWMYWGIPYCSCSPLSLTLWQMWRCVVLFIFNWPTWNGKEERLQQHVPHNCWCDAAVVFFFWVSMFFSRSYSFCHFVLQRFLHVMIFKLHKLWSNYSVAHWWFPRALELENCEISV